MWVIGASFELEGQTNSKSSLVHFNESETGCECQGQIDFIDQDDIDLLLSPVNMWINFTLHAFNAKICTTCSYLTSALLGLNTT